MRPRRRGLLALGNLLRDLGRGFGAQGGPQQRPHLRLLELDVLPGVHDELPQQLLELRVTRAELVQVIEHLLGGLLLAGRLVGQRVTGLDVVAHGRPEVHLLERLVLGLLDDQFFGHLLAQRQLILAGPGGHGRALLQLSQHALDLLVVMAQDREYVCHLSSLVTSVGDGPPPCPSECGLTVARRGAGTAHHRPGELTTDRKKEAAMTTLSAKHPPHEQEQPYPGRTATIDPYPRRNSTLQSPGTASRS